MVIYLFPLKILCLYILVQTTNTVEYNQHTRISQQTESNGCTLPPLPKQGQWKIHPNPVPLSTGETVPSGTILKISCQDNHKLDGENTTTCINNNWTNEIGRCLRTCPTINGTSSLNVTCTRKGEKLDSCINPVEGTRAKFSCASFYKKNEQGKDDDVVCSNGIWSGRRPTCTPACGRFPEKTVNRIVGGKNVTKGEYTWQVAIYTTINYELICGGTMLNQKMILTAAHCVTDTEGNAQPKENFIIAAGKYFRQYNHSGDAKYAQFSSVYEIHIPGQYKAATQNYLGDIAVIITNKPFNISETVGPVCVNWNRNDYQDISKNPTFVSGWGFTVEYKDPSPVLKHLQVPIVEDNECSENLPPDFREYMTHDKLCAGFLNSSTSICRGDSGGGLVSRMYGKFYIVGVVSVSPLAESNEGGCDSQQYALYTKFWYYIQDFLFDIESRFKSVRCNDDPNCKTSPLLATTRVIRPDVSSSTGCGGYCVVPNRPDFATWKAFVGEEFSPVAGIMVPQGTSLSVNCVKGYQLDGENTTTCVEGRWSSNVGRCRENCQSLRNTSSTLVTCNYKNETLENCEFPPGGTFASIRCAQYYYNERSETKPTYLCHDGRWGEVLPNCLPECGKQRIEILDGWSDGNSINIEHFPWHVGLYTAKDKKFICSGTLSDYPDTVLTDRRCILNDDGEVLGEDEIIVAAGKTYRQFNDSRDRNAQYSEVHEMRDNYLGEDVAAVYLKTQFALSKEIAPACFDDQGEPSFDDFAYVSSWGSDASKASHGLKRMKISFDVESKCSKIQQDFSHFGFENVCGRNDNDTSACDVDTGSALLQKINGKYYIVGFATSTSPTSLKNECKSHRHRWYIKL